MTGDDHQSTLDAHASGEPATHADNLDALPLRQRAPLGETFDGERDLYDTLGYDRDLTVEDYWNRYLRQDLARSIVDAPAKTTWREPPDVIDDDNDENQTAFEEDVETLWREHELLARLEAVDRLSGIGHFGVLVLGLKDGRDLSEPARDGAFSDPSDLAYLMPVGQDRVDDWSIVNDETDERFGLPDAYEIDFSQRKRTPDESTWRTTDENVREVHHTRVIHVPAGNTLDNLLFGRPRLEAVYNRLQDLEKVVGASSEMMWRAADYGLALKADPEHAGSLNDDAKEEVEAEMQKWYHGLQPFLRLAGFDVEKLGGEQADPTGVFDALIKLIAGETGIPQRILTGSERGELASTQDRASWLGRISERQSNFAEPKILRELIDRLVDLGIVSQPKAEGDAPGGYDVEWPNLFELSDAEKAEMAAQKAQALNRARDPASAEPIMTTGEVRQEVFGMDPEVGAEVDIDEGEPGEDGGGLLDELDLGDPPIDEGDDVPDDPDEDVDEDDDAVAEQFENASIPPADVRADGSGSN